MKIREFLEDADFFTYLIMLGICFLFLATLFIAEKGGKDVDNALLDFWSYMLPILAGALAGGGIYFKDDSELYFGWSCFVLVLGLMAYMHLKGFGNILYFIASLLASLWTAVDLYVSVDDVAASRSTARFSLWLLNRSILLIAFLTVTLTLWGRVK
ncbi:hypothetical protein [Luteibacter sp. ME-Dv--P-043b]|uniref:hypothetical protein n=1 Tax=Luteibacter sp. ME-Dv--P-043b TaxID=3040291 RepID=UPI0025544FA5|nr:hypothetical protein [Luteibacter sp. ME-Dv--P-043b]